MNAIYPAQDPAVLSAVIFYHLEELDGEGPILLQRRNSETDPQNMVGVSRGGALY